MAEGPGRSELANSTCRTGKISGAAALPWISTMLPRWMRQPRQAMTQPWALLILSGSGLHSV